MPSDSSDLTTWENFMRRAIQLSRNIDWDERGELPDIIESSAIIQTELLNIETLKQKINQPITEQNRVAWIKTLAQIKQVREALASGNRKIQKKYGLDMEEISEMIEENNKLTGEPNLMEKKFYDNICNLLEWVGKKGEFEAEIETKQIVVKDNMESVSAKLLGLLEKAATFEESAETSNTPENEDDSEDEGESTGVVPKEEIEIAVPKTYQIPLENVANNEIPPEERAFDMEAIKRKLKEQKENSIADDTE